MFARSDDSMSRPRLRTHHFEYDRILYQSTRSVETRIILPKHAWIVATDMLMYTDCAPVPQSR